MFGSNLKTLKMEELSQESSFTLSADGSSLKCFRLSGLLVSVLVISYTRSAPTIAVEGLAQHLIYKDVLWVLIPVN